jgi:hypothetical protein
MVSLTRPVLKPEIRDNRRLSEGGFFSMLQDKNKTKSRFSIKTDKN